MEPIIIYLPVNVNAKGKIELTIEELKKYVMDAYEKGKMESININPVIPPQPQPYPHNPYYPPVSFTCDGIIMGKMEW